MKRTLNMQQQSQWNNFSSQSSLRQGVTVNRQTSWNIVTRERKWRIGEYLRAFEHFYFFCHQAARTNKYADQSCKLKEDNSTGNGRVSFKETTKKPLIFCILNEHFLDNLLKHFRMEINDAHELCLQLNCTYPVWSFPVPRWNWNRWLALRISRQNSVQITSDVMWPHFLIGIPYLHNEPWCAIHSDRIFLL